MPSYRTEFIVPADRYVCLQLPPDWPVGPARIVVQAKCPDPEADPEPADAEVDRQDIEWWDEFDGPLGA